MPSGVPSVDFDLMDDSFLIHPLQEGSLCHTLSVIEYVPFDPRRGVKVSRDEKDI